MRCPYSEPAAFDEPVVDGAFLPVESFGLAVGSLPVDSFGLPVESSRSPDFRLPADDLWSFL